MKPSDDRGLVSRLPNDDAYWEAFAERLVVDAADKMSAYRHPATRWWVGLGRVAAPLAIGAAAAVVAARLWLPPAAGPPPAIPYGLGAQDPLAAALLASGSPPTLATLMATPTQELAP